MSGTTLKRTIGDATFPAIGYGSMGIAFAYGTPLPLEERLKVGMATLRPRPHTDH